MTRADAPLVLDRLVTPRGELVLRRSGRHFEIISNGVFLMDTRGGESERELVRAAVAEHPGPDPLRMMIGGLGVGFSLVEALRSPRVGPITVVEVEPAVIGWHASHLRDVSGGVLDDPRVDVVGADLLEWLGGGRGPFDVICLDTDNGPGWTTVPANAGLYTDAGLAALRATMRPAGVLAVWSAAAAPEFAAALERIVGPVEVIAVPVPRGEPDIVYVARNSGARKSA